MRLNRVTTFRKLKAELQEFWVKLVNTYFVDKNYVVVSIMFTVNILNDNLLSPIFNSNLLSPVIILKLCDFLKSLWCHNSY